jgi:autotransporter translocation and assembly factor TamB
MNQLGSGERVSLGARAAALAAGAIATPLADSVARALDLDVFEIEPTTEAGGGASVTVGRQVSDNLFVGFSQQFGAGDVSQVSFEYRLSEYLSIITSLAHGAEGDSHSLRRAEEAGIDLIFSTR